MRGLIISISLALALTACAHNQHSAKNVSVLPGERSELYFTGRGSAAGIMMDAYMSGAGVAIGIAIDEGIAKDIAAALLLSNPEFSMPALVQSELREHSKNGTQIKGLKSIVIDKYGFQSAPDDKVVPLLEFTFVCDPQISQQVKYKPADDSKAIGIEQAKTEGKLVEVQIREAVGELIKSSALECQK